MAQGWHYGGLIGKQPYTGGAAVLRTSGVRAVADAGAIFGDATGLEKAYATGDLRTIAGDGTATVHQSIDFGDSGNKLYVGGYATGSPSTSWVKEYTLSSPYVVNSSATYIGELQIGSSGGSPDVVIRPGGAELFVSQTGSLFKVPLGTPYALSSAGTQTSVSWPSGNEDGLAFKPDGTVAFVTDGGNRRIRSYTLSSAWDITTLSASSTLATTAYTSSTILNGLAFTEDGKRLYFIEIGSSSSVVHCVELTTAWDITTAGATATQLDITTYMNGNTFTSGMIAVRDDANALAVGFRPTGNPPGATDNIRQFALVPTNKPTQRWGRQLGRSPFDGTALRNTGVITTTEAYQLQL